MTKVTLTGRDFHLSFDLNGVEVFINSLTKALIKFVRRLRILFSQDNIDYIGSTSFPVDARDIYSRWRKEEPLLDGPHIREFEEALSDYYGGLEVITFGTGRMALYAILKAMNLREGDEVIIPGYTCIVAPNAIHYAGLKPVYVDVSLRNFNMLPELVRKAVNRRTCAILAQHTFGIPCDMDALLDISQRFGVPLIEDGAHAIGARWDGQLVGRYGYAGFFSTQAIKMFSTERGGYAVTSDRDLAQRIREIQDEAPYNPATFERACLLRWCYHAAFLNRPVLNPRLRLFEYLVRKLRVPGIISILDYDRKEYEAALDGERLEPYPVRLGNLMAYAGLLQLRRLEEDIAHRKQLAEYLETWLPQFGASVAVYDHRRAQPSWVRFSFVVEDSNRFVVEGSNRWAKIMERCGLTPGVWFNDPIHPKGSNWSKAGYVRGMCPNAEYLSEHILNMPVDRRVSISRIDNFLRLCYRLQNRI